MCRCLKRTEVETSHNTEMLKIFFFFFIFSATERQDHPTHKMSSQAFAHLHHISLDLQDPSMGSRAMHDLLISNLKLTKRNLTVDLLLIRNSKES